MGMGAALVALSAACSGDATTAPEPPVGPQASATIGPDGGEVGSDDGRFTLTIPAGALGSDTEMTISEVSGDEIPAELQALGATEVYDLQPDGLEFATPATVDVHIESSSSSLDGAPIVGVISDHDGALALLTPLTNTVDDTGITASAPVNHFSKLSVLESEQVTVALGVEPEQVSKGESFELSLGVTTSSDSKADATITTRIFVDPSPIVSLPDNFDPPTFTLTRDEAQIVQRVATGTCVGVGTARLLVDTTPESSEDALVLFNLDIDDVVEGDGHLLFAAPGKVTCTLPPPSLSGFTDLDLEVGESGSETFIMDGTSPFTVTATSSNQEVLPDANIFGQDKCTAAGNCTLTVVPAAEGTATVTVVMTDAEGQSATGTFQVVAHAMVTASLGLHEAPGGMTELEQAVPVDPFAGHADALMATLAGKEGYVVVDLTTGGVVRNEVGNGNPPIYGAVPISEAPPGPNTSAAILAYGPNGAFLRSYDPVTGNFSAFAFTFMNGMSDVSNAGGTLTGGEQVFVEASGVGFVAVQPANGFYESTGEAIPASGIGSGTQVSAFELTAGGPVLVITREPTMGRLFFAPRDGSDPTLVGSVGPDARRIRCLESLCAVTSFAGDYVTILTWDGATAPVIIGDVAVGDGPVDLDLTSLPNGDVLVVSTGFNDDTWTLIEMAPDGHVVSNSTMPVDDGCTSPGHAAFFTDADGPKVLVTCFGSSSYDILGALVP